MLNEKVGLAYAGDAIAVPIMFIFGAIIAIFTFGRYFGQNEKSTPTRQW
jgi:hypothetical protein